MRVLIPTCDRYIKYIEALQLSTRGTHLETLEFWILGYEEPEFQLDDNWKFFKLNDQDRGAKYWGEDMINFMKDYDESHFIYGNDDCAITYFRPELLAKSWMVCRSHEEIGRFALMAEGSKRNYHALFIEEPLIDVSDVVIKEFDHSNDYNLSLGWSIWNKDCFTSFLRPVQDPWDFELSSCGTNRVEGLDQWKYCAFLPDSCIDGAYFRRKNVDGVIENWHKGYYGHDLTGDIKTKISKIVL